MARQKTIRSITLTLLIFFLFTQLENAAEQTPETHPQFYEYGRIYLFSPEVDLYLQYIKDCLKSFPADNTPLQVRISLGRDSYDMSKENSSEIQSLLQMMHDSLNTFLAKEKQKGTKKYSGITKKIEIQSQELSGWYSPLDDIKYLLIVETSAPVYERNITLKRYLKNFIDPKRLLLPGRISSLTLDFSMPKECRMGSQSHFYLNFDHSEMLSPFKSSINLFLNSRGLKSQRLDSSNCYQGEILQYLKPGILRDYNELTVTVGQLFDIECTPPFDPALWTTIAGDSYLYLSYYRHLPTLDLAKFPYPFFDPLMPVPEPIYFYLDPKMDHDVLSYLLEMAAFLGKQYEWRRGDICGIDHLENWGNGPLIIVAKLDCPILKQFQNLTAIQSNGTGFMKVFYLYQKPVLLISGKNPAEIKKALDTLMYPDTANLLNSDWAEVKRLYHGEKKKPPFLLGKTDPVSITFRELGLDNFTLRGSGPAEQILNIPLIFGSSLPEFEAHMDLVFSYSSQLNIQTSSIEIQGNGVSFASLPLDMQKGVTLGKDRISIPHNLINGPFALNFYAHFWPAQMDYCKWNPSDYPWFTLFNTSRLFLPRDIFFKMPELKWFRLWAYPFVDNPDSPRIRIEHDDSLEAKTCALNLAFFLGSKANIMAPGFIDAHLQHTLDSDVNVIRIFTTFPQSNDPKNWKPLLTQDMYNKLYHDTAANHDICTHRMVGSLEEFMVPKKEKIILGVHAPLANSLKPLVKTLHINPSISGVAGVLTIVDYVDNEILFHTVKPEKPKQWGSISTGRKAKRFFLDNLGTILIVAPILLFLMYLLMRIFKHLLVKRKKKAEGDNEETKE